MNPHRVIVAGGGVAGLEGILALHTQAPPGGSRSRCSSPRRSWSSGRCWSRARSARVMPHARRSRGSSARPARSICASRSRRWTPPLPRSRPAPATSCHTTRSCSRSAPGPWTPTSTRRRSHRPTRTRSPDCFGTSRRATARASRSSSPRGPVWPFPAYELALLTAREASGMGEDVRVTVVTPERRPLEAFGDAVSACSRGDAARSPRQARRRAPRPISTRSTQSASSRSRGSRGAASTASPRTTMASSPSTATAPVRGVPGVYAAGDGTDFPVKLGGLAAEMADAAAEHIAARAGADIEPQPFVPVLRGKLLTGGEPRSIRGGEGRPMPPTTCCGGRRRRSPHATSRPSSPASRARSCSTSTPAPARCRCASRSTSASGARRAEGVVP